MNKSIMQSTIDNLYRILSKRATQNIVLERRVEAMTDLLDRLDRRGGLGPEVHEEIRCLIGDIKQIRILR